MSATQPTTLPSGHVVCPLEGEERAKIMKDFPGYTTGLIRLTPGRWLYAPRFTDFADKLYNFKYRKDDALVMTYSKCGTTWTTEIVWTMKNNPDLQHPEAETPDLERIPFMDMDMFIPLSDNMHAFTKGFTKLCPKADLKDGEMIQLAEAMPDPRTLKTHLPLSLLGPNLLEETKVVYVARNPKDTMISYFHHHRLFREQDFIGSLEEFAEYFMNDDLLYGPYWLHMKEAWERRDHPNMHFIFYEDLKADIKGELKKLDTFLGTGLTEQQLENVIKYTSFEEMKKRSEKVNNFMNDENFVNQEVRNKDGGFFRQGKSGGWKTKLTPELAEKLDRWISEKWDFGISFN